MMGTAFATAQVIFWIIQIIWTICVILIPIFLIVCMIRIGVCVTRIEEIRDIFKVQEERKYATKVPEKKTGRNLQQMWTGSWKLKRIMETFGGQTILGAITGIDDREQGPSDTVPVDSFEIFCPPPYQLRSATLPVGSARTVWGWVGR